MLSTAILPWDPCRELKVSISIVEVMNIGETAAAKGKQRQEGPEVVEREGAPAAPAA